MDELLAQIRACEICKEALPLPPRPVMAASPNSRIAIIGQAPGSKVQASGVPWDDQSGKLLRQWLNVESDTFYNPDNFAIIPMGFCYPGKGKSGDMPPRPECAPEWHPKLLAQMDKLELTLLIGQYAQRYYLQDAAKKNLTETVRSVESYLPHFFPLPHPSPRNRFWMRKNPWFQEETLPRLREFVSRLLNES